ncbi:11998_t:CDS:1 [Dentiscutata erythropus]|uniref:11998_t:CDS:1 n=1 Tax=Dentiscutata erythropus TaxID=1348616 RepID=A0A9N9G900_9GLOM|nr:11998_t:CDS:1 [Dentiscutata erythropus]
MANTQNYLTEVKYQTNIDHSSIPSDPPPPFSGSGPTQFQSSQPQQVFSNQPLQQQVSPVQSSMPQPYSYQSEPQQFYPNQYPQGQQQYVQQVNQAQYSQKQQPQLPQSTYQQANTGFSPTEQQTRGIPNQQQTSALPQEQVVYVVQPPPPPVMVMNPNQGYINISSHVPVRVTCPHCNNSVVTVVTEDLGSTAWILAIILCLVFWPLVWIPCVLSNFKDKTHTCPNCRTVLGVVKA